MIASISELLAMCGFISVRMFLPCFLFLSAMRFWPKWEAACPARVLEMAKHVPAWQTSNTFLILLAILSVVEIIANRNPDVKRFMVEDFDRYAKPLVAILFTLGVFPSSVFSMVGSVPAVSQASLTTVFCALIIGGVTVFFCRLRAMVLDTLLSLDPENSFGVQTLVNFVEESSVVVFFFLAFIWWVLAPIVAGGIMLVEALLGRMGRELKGRHERFRSHPCPECSASGKETIVSNCALICPVCGAKQSDVRRVSCFGFSGARPLGALSAEDHGVRLLRVHRCRWCASPLGKDHTCPVCGREQWENPMPERYLRCTDRYAKILVGLAGGLVLLSLVPGIPGSFLQIVPLLLLRWLAIQPLYTYMGAGTRILAAFLVLYLKVAVIVPLLLLTLILSFFPGGSFLAPAVGLVILIPLGGRYFHARKRFKQRYLKARS